MSEGLASKEDKFKILPIGMLTGLVPQLLGTIKYLIGFLNKHKGLRDKVHLLYEATPSRLGEVVFSSTI